jgi:hypothetical protein
LAIFFLLPTKKFLPTSFKFQLLEFLAKKQKEQRQKQLHVDVSFSDVFSLPVHFDSLLSSLTVYFWPVYLSVEETAEIETGMAGNGIRQTCGRN